MALGRSLTIARHAVPRDPDTGLSPLQTWLLQEPAPVRIAAAPTGAGKSYAFQRALLAQPEGQRVLFIVPTRRLAQNLARSLIEDLSQQPGWSRTQAEHKVAIWSSDATAQLHAEGITRVGPYRLRQFHSLDLTREGGEMVIALPESLSYLLLQRRSLAGQSDIGVWHLLNGFHHVVFDEFHSISPQGFGLAATLARIAAGGAVLAKVSFLSATPLNIRPVLERVGIPPEAIAERTETVEEDAAISTTTTHRVLHGDVALTLVPAATLAEMLWQWEDLIASEVQAGRQVVVIYNALIELQRQLGSLENLADRIGLDPREVLLINSIDDSRTGPTLSTTFTVGRQQDPTRYRWLLATSSLEMGVTFNTRLLFMEPGFAPLNFLQRYGRAARGAQDGWVIVRDHASLQDKNAWFRQLGQWHQAAEGQTRSIHALTQQLTASVTRRFAVTRNDFGDLPQRAAYCTGLYWRALLCHTNKGHQRERLHDLTPSPAKCIYKLLKQVATLTQDPTYKPAAEAWLARFEQATNTLRDVEAQVRIREGNHTLYARHTWLRRHTELGSYPTAIADDGVEELRLPPGETFNQYLLAQSRYVPRTLTVFFPHTQMAQDLPDTPDLVTSWCKALHAGRNPGEIMAWQLHPEAMQAAEELVKITGLVPYDDPAFSLGASSLVL